MSAKRTTARKGEQTRDAILDVALAQAARDGLEGLTIGALAKSAGMSKSGVFAHFGSREDLQIAVLQEYERRFVAEVFTPALEAPRGLGRLSLMLERWLEKNTRDAGHGCLWISSAVEYDDRPGRVRDALVGMIQEWKTALSRTIQLAVDTGELRASTDISELVFDIYGVVLVLHHDYRLLASPAALARARRALARVIDARRPDSRQHAETPRSREREPA